MNKDTQPQEENEVDILILFDYFKNGIKQIFQSIGKLFIGIFHYLIIYIITLKKHWILVGVLCFGFATLGLLKKNFVSPKYKYEMVVNPKFNSVYELYNNISGFKASHPDFSIEKIEIEPVVRTQDEVKMYYAMPYLKNTARQELYKYGNDTVFYRSVTLEDFKQTIQSTDYPLQKIFVKSSNSIDIDKLEQSILSPFENAQWKGILTKRRGQIQERARQLQNILVLGDSILASYSHKVKNFNENVMLNLNKSSSRNPETDLIREMEGASGNLEYVSQKLEETNEVIGVISQMRQVADDSTRSKFNVGTGFLLGLILSTLIIGAIYFNRFLTQFEKKNQL